MKAEKLERRLAIAANLGVLIGILFLIAEIDQANRIAQNESESNLNNAAAILSANVRGSADLMVKLMDESPVLTAEEEIQAEQLASEFMAVWGSANNAYRSELIADYLFEIYMVSMEQNLSKYPGLAIALSELYRPRWADISAGESELTDRIRDVLRAQGIKI
jgi:hypothetical protein